MPNSSWKIKILVNNWVGEGPCIAEHGLSMAVQGGDLPDGQFVLFDTGKSPEVLANNANAMNVDWDGLRQIVLSHSHYDHSGSLMGIHEWVKRPVSVLTYLTPSRPRRAANPLSETSGSHLHGNSWRKRAFHFQGFRSTRPLHPRFS